MTATASGTGMAGMFGGIVDQFQTKRIEPGKPFAQNDFKLAERTIRAGLTHVGKTFLNGLTDTLA